MTGHSKSATSQNGMDVIFGPAPILPGEDASAHEALLERVSAAVKPTDILEEIWVRDYVHVTWDILRLRRIKTSLITSAVSDALAHFLKPFMPEGPGYAEAEKAGTITAMVRYEANKEMTEEIVARDWARKDKAAVKFVNALVAQGKFSMNEVISSAFIERLDEIERVDHLLTIGETRRNVVLREIDRHRVTFARSLRNTVQEIEDAEFETIEPESNGQKSKPNRSAA